MTIISFLLSSVFLFGYSQCGACDAVTQEGWGSTETCTYGCVDSYPGNAKCAEYCRGGSICSPEGKSCCNGERYGITCSGGRVKSSSYCGSFGCSAGECFEECGIGSSCSASGDFCCTTTKRAVCSGGQVSSTYSGDCEYGCGSGRCLGPCDSGAICRTSQCCWDNYNSPLAVCSSGKIGTRSQCELGCNEGRCVEDVCEKGAYCSDFEGDYCCNDDVSTRCNGDPGYHSLSTVCQGKYERNYGCNPITKLCNPHACMENAKDEDACGDIQCCIREDSFETYVLVEDCTFDDRIVATEKCSFGCSYGRCFNSSSACVQGAECFAPEGEDYCCGDIQLNKCVSGSAVNISVCEFGCSMHDKRCYEAHEVGAFCETSLCFDDGMSLAFCDVDGSGRIENVTGCSFGCKSSMKRCYEQSEIGSYCEPPGNIFCMGNDYYGYHEVHCSESNIVESSPDPCDEECIDGSGCAALCDVGTKRSSFHCKLPPDEDFWSITSYDYNECTNQFCCCDDTLAVKCNDEIVTHRKKYDQCTDKALRKLNKYIDQGALLGGIFGGFGGLVCVVLLGSIGICVVIGNIQEYKEKKKKEKEMEEQAPQTEMEEEAPQEALQAEMKDSEC